MQDDAGQHPRWHIPRKHRVPTESNTDHFGRNFGDFFSTNPASSAIAGNSKRHFASQTSEEASWKPTLRMVPAVHHEDRPTGKRSLHSRASSFASQSSKKMVPEANHQNFDPPSIPVKRKVLNDEGSRVHEGRSEETVLENAMSRKSGVSDPRNGIPASRPGDKSYAHPEASPSFFAQEGIVPQSSFGMTRQSLTSTSVPLATTPTRGVAFSDRIQKERHDQERMDVKGLDDWKPAPR
eukprot:ANDGO_02848.mRNA.1 hypothetical protein